MKKLMRALGSPQDSFPSIHIAGTNGKGSTAAILERTFREANYKTGLYTSPHLVWLNERFQINGSPIDNHTLNRLTKHVLKKASSIIKGEITQFEALTAIAFLYFFEQKIDIGIIEVGLGGRLDATNVLKRVVASVITNIDLDHTQILGNTIQKVAYEKAGIIKPGVPVITGAKRSALQVIRLVAKKQKAPVFISTVPNNRGILFRPSSRKKIDENSNSNFPLSTQLQSCFRPIIRGQNHLQCLRLQGPHQYQNARIALTVINLCGAQFNINEDHVRRAFSRVSWPGRFEEIRIKGHTVILDGAHNPAAIRVLVKTLRKKGFHRINLLFGVLRDKKFDAMIRSLCPLINSVVVVPLPSERSATVNEIRACFPAKMSVEVAGSVLKGWKRIFKFGQTHPIVITGSLYLVGEAKKIFASEHKRGAYEF